MKYLKNKKAALALKIILVAVAAAFWVAAIKSALGGVDRFGGRFFTEIYDVFAVTIGFPAILLFFAVAAAIFAARTIFRKGVPPSFGKLVSLLGLGFFVVMAVERAMKVSRRYTWDDSYFIGKTLFNDSIVLISLVLLFAAMAVINRDKISLVIKLVVVSIVTVYLADFLVFNYFMTRLYFQDVQTMADNTGTWSVFKLMLHDPLCRNHIYAWAILCALFLQYGKPLEFLKSRLLFAGSVVFMAAVFLRPQIAFPYEWAVRNFAQVYLSTTYQNNYSGSFQKKMMEKKELLEWKKEKTTPEKPRNIIFVDVESLSSWQSEYFSGIRDVTPNFDRIARENLSYRNFYANSYKTTGGLLAMLKGKVMMPPTKSAGGLFEFSGYAGGEDTLPRVLKKAGYRTEFLTTGDLSFTQKGEWLTSIGFDFMEGHTNPLYDNYPRFFFRSVRDEALYKRALSRLYEEDLKEPFFLFLETVSTHEPFTDPFTGAPSTIEATMKYADEQLGVFYDEIKKRGFLEDGILIITGDHRSKTNPLEEEELKYGESYLARIPLVIGGAGFPKGAVEEAPFQQTDILPSLAARFGGVSFSSPFYGNFLGEKKISPRYIVHARGDDRSLVNVFGAGGEAVIKLVGDGTYLSQGGLDDSSLVLDTINCERIVRSANQSAEKTVAGASNGVEED